MKSIPLGIDDFASIKRQCYYVDHSQIINDLQLIAPTATVLFLRPRRFGKSLALSMIKTFFESDIKTRAELFADLEIGKNKELMSLDPIPVVMLNMKEVKSTTYEGLIGDICDLIQRECRRHYQLLTETDLSEFDKAFFENVFSEDFGEKELKTSLLKLTEIIHRVTSKAPLLLIDEYDAPTQNAKMHGYLDSCIPLMKALYGNSLKSNCHIAKGILTGILKLSKISMHSDLNNPIIDDGIDSPFAEHFGFSYEESKELLDYYGETNAFDDVISWYGGYRFNDVLCVNPWSLLSFLLYKRRYRPYWTSTSSNVGLADFAFKENGNTDILSLILKDKGTLSLNRIHGGDYESLGDSKDSLLSFLLYSGYLSIKGEAPSGEFVVGIPNIEIRSIFSNEILSHFSSDNYASLLSDFGNAFISGDAETLGKLLQDNLLQCLSYYDFAYEKAYQAMVLTLTALLFRDYVIKSEHNAGVGRCDISISPKNEGSYGAIIEIKYLSSRSSKVRMKASADSAIRQVENHHYVSELLQRNAKPIDIYGISFYKNTVVISSKRIVDK